MGALTRGRGVVVVVLALASVAAPGQAAERSFDAAAIQTMETDELKLLLAPVERERLEVISAELLAALAAVGTELADALVRQLRLEQANDSSDEALVDAQARVEELTAQTNSLLSRTAVVLDAFEVKGADVSDARAYVAAVESLRAAEQSGSEAPPPELTEEQLRRQLVRERVASLVARVRAEPPAHERPTPWAVPLAEFRLELQPLTTEQINERMGKWREILQREVRRRVRVDILLNDPSKLRQSLADLGVDPETSNIDEIKAELASQSQEQQRIVNAIVERMKAAIRFVEIRGGDAKAVADYVGSATGQRLNLSDPAVLRAQVFAWLRSPDGGLRLGVNVGKFAAIAFVFWLLSRLVARLVQLAVNRLPRASSLLGTVLSGLVRQVTLFIGIVIAISMLGVNIGPLLAMIGAAGLVIGLALQGTLSNFASGILILINRPYDVGDVVDAGGVFGKVEAMNLVSTSVLTFDNKLMMVPNNQIWNGVITNVTGKDIRRVDLTFGIGYADDMDRALTIISEAIAEHPKTLEEPQAKVRVHELGDNSVNIIARPWARTSDYWEVYWDVLQTVKRRFDEEGINIPFPQRDLHLTGPIEVKLAGQDAAGGQSPAAT